MESLFTPHDGNYGHVHKVLGLLALLSYINKFDQFFMHRSFTVDPFVIGLHLLLSWSSLIFYLPPVRSEKAPMIWPEFRAHSILFATRSLVAMSLIISGNSNHCTRFATVMGTIALADLATKQYKITATTMRDMPFPDWVTQKARTRLNLYYSTSQVFATACLLFSPSVERAYIILFPIQIAAFLMTLVRKGFIGPLSWHVLYSLSLGLNYIHGMFARDALPVEFYICSLLFCVLRFRFRWNKYLLWGVISLITQEQWVQM